MAWITLTEDHVTGSAALTKPELAIARTLLLPDGVTDTLSDVMTSVTREVRGYVAAHKPNPLGEAGTIPDELERAALSRIVCELATRIPGKLLLTEQRASANDAAVKLLEQTARGLFAIVPPVTAAPAIEQASPVGVERISSGTRIAGRDSMAGL